MAKPFDRLNTRQVDSNGGLDREPGSPGQRYDISSIQQHFDTQTIETGQRAKTDSTGAFGLLDNPTLGGFEMLRLVSEYFAGQFIPNTENKAFKHELLNVGSFLIDKWYFSGLYVVYSDEVRKEEQRIAEENGINGWKPCHFPKSKFRFFIRSDENGNKFRSLANSQIELELDPSKLVYFSHRGGRNFLHWGSILMEYGEMLEMSVNAARMSLKTVNVRKGATAVWNNIASQFDNNKTYLVFDSMTEKPDATQEPFTKEFLGFKVQDVPVILKNGKGLFDARAEGLGGYGKDVDEKKERVTVHEGNMSTKLVNNVIESMLNNLRAAFGELKEIYQDIPEDFDVEIIRLNPQLNQQQGANPEALTDDAIEAMEN